MEQWWHAMVISRYYKHFLLALSYVTSYYTQNLAIIMNGMFSFRQSSKEKRDMCSLVKLCITNTESYLKTARWLILKTITTLHYIPFAPANYKHCVRNNWYDACTRITSMHIWLIKDIASYLFRNWSVLSFIL